MVLYPCALSKVNLSTGFLVRPDLLKRGIGDLDGLGKL
jgi:hypothetical protein